MMKFGPLISIILASMLSFSTESPIFLEYWDSYGQYTFGYSSQDSAKSEIRRLDGSVSGVFSYIDANGKIQTWEYLADAENGYQVKATNLPVPVRDTPEVTAARQAHFQALRTALDTGSNDRQEFQEIDDYFSGFPRLYDTYK